MNAMNRKRFFSHKTQILLAILVIGTALYNHETVEFYLYYKYNCMVSAIDIGDGNKLGVCDRQVLDSIPDAPLITAFVYDTSDQLLLPETKRELAWQKAAWKIGLRETVVIRDPITKGEKSVTLDKFGAIVPLGWHFYHVQL